MIFRILTEYHLFYGIDYIFVVVMTKLYKIKENNFKSISYFVDCLMT